MVRVGLAYSGYLPALLDRDKTCIDFVEVPIELLRHNPLALDAAPAIAVILHCASLNIAGSVAPSEATVESVEHWVQRTGTPWVGEHLAFITADRAAAGPGAEAYAPGEPYNLGFTVSPPMNAATVRHVVEKSERYAKRLKIPLLLENSPLYFTMPGTTMTQVEFVRELCRQSPMRLLLDLSHFSISARNLGFDAEAELLRYPLDRVDEIHISGSSADRAIHWDDHSTPAGDDVYRLLEITLAHCAPTAITLEYNWSAVFPVDTAMNEIDRTRRLVASI